MKIIIKIINAYGNERIFPICDRARLFIALTNRKCFTRCDLEIIKQLGYEVEIEPQELGNK